jgi:hypothetical protein
MQVLGDWDVMLCKNVEFLYRPTLVIVPPELFAVTLAETGTDAPLLICSLLVGSVMLTVGRLYRKTVMTALVAVSP